MFNPYIFPIKGDISRADAVVLYEEASRIKGSIREFGPGGSTIFLAASGNPVYSYEHEEKWLKSIEKNVKLYNDTFFRNKKLNVRVYTIDYSNKHNVYERVTSDLENDVLVYVDGQSDYRKMVLDFILEHAIQGLHILYHDCFSLQHRETVLKMAIKYANKIDRIDFKYRKSNMFRIIVGEKREYVNWNDQEKGNHRVPWDCDKVK